MRRYLCVQIKPGWIGVYYRAIDARAFTLSSEPITLEIAAYPEAIETWIDVSAGRVDKLLGERPYCNDVGPSVEPQSVWQGVSGTVTVVTSANGQTDQCAGEPYQADVLIEDVIYALDDETVFLPSLFFSKVAVGWCPG